ncbi:MAG: FG-GAP-like repeat-containing protein [Vicinamibacterales bacterium]
MPTRLGALAALLSTLACNASTGPVRPTRDTRERAYASNNVGVALLEQLNYPDAAVAFRNALAIDPTLAVGRLNLGLALLYQQDLDGAAREVTEAATRMPSAPEPAYVLGLIARAQNRNDAARGFFEQVRRVDARDVGTSINIAQIALEDRRYDDAIAALRPTVASEPYHITAAYVLGLALTRAGQTTEGQRLLQRAQGLRGASYAVTFGTGYLEQGRYAEAVASSGLEPDLVDASATPKFTVSSIATGTAVPVSPVGRRFSRTDLNDARALVTGLGGGQALIDVDGSGQLALVVASGPGQRLYRQTADGWTDATRGSGLDSAQLGSTAVGVVTADVDNNGAADVFVLRYGTSSLYRNDGKGHFADVTKQSGIPSYASLPSTAAFVDLDHDGDVDLVIGGAADLEATRRQTGRDWAFPAEFARAPLLVLRNDGKGHFTDITQTTKLDLRAHVLALVPTDFDNHRDVDLLVVTSDTPPLLFSNQRDGTFKDVAEPVGLVRGPGTSGGVTAVAVGDVNRDDTPDFFFSHVGGAELLLSDGHGRYSPAPADDRLRAATAAQFVDYDNDGLLDLVALTPGGLAVSRNVGSSWVDVTASATSGIPADAAAARALSIADTDGDGTPDLVVTVGGAAWRFQNSGDRRNRSLRVRLRGRVTNRTGVGAKVQVRAGGLTERFETSATFPAVSPSDIVFGLGARAGAEVARVLWPSGIVQAEIAPTTPAPAAGASTTAEASPATLPSPFLIEELDRKPSSCPFLFTWNGERFEFVTDFLGGGEMGYWEGPGVYNHPDPVEYVRIRDDQLKAVDGRLRLRVTNELEEVLFLDRLRLTTIAHPADVQVFPNEGMTVEPKPYRLHAVRRLHAPARVTDEHGHDVTMRVVDLDRQYPDDFALESVRGYAAPHALTIELGDTAHAQTLLLTGWTDYAFSSDNVAAHQRGLKSQEPALEVRTSDGRWRPLDVAIGIPVGRPQTIPIDLSGRLRAGEHLLRLTTSMRIYWDQIQVGETMTPDGFTSTTADPRSAALRARGFSAEVRPDGEDPPGYDYSQVSTASPWKVFAGEYTREGDVLSLLVQTDDQFVIARTGDEVALEFDATPGALPSGWTRTYLLQGDGFSKEMDINSASPDTVDPLPFHAMSSYPYPAGERYPETPEHRAYREQFNTRRVVRSIPSLQLERPAPRETSDRTRRESK